LELTGDESEEDDEDEVDTDGDLDCCINIRMT
jgi:hypothetical protein